MAVSPLFFPVVSRYFSYFIFSKFWLASQLEQTNGMAGKITDEKVEVVTTSISCDSFSLILTVSASLTLATGRTNLL